MKKITFNNIRPPYEEISNASLILNNTSTNIIDLCILKLLRVYIV